MKSLGKRKEFFKNVEYQLSMRPETITDLISELVKINVSSYNERSGEVSFVNYLTKEEIELRGTTGKVGFGINYNEQKANVQDSIRTALQAFQDGLFKVFINDVEQTVEAPSIIVNDGDQIVFIKLTMLAGRMW